MLNCAVNMNVDPLAAGVTRRWHRHVTGDCNTRDTGTTTDDKRNLYAWSPSAGNGQVSGDPQPMRPSANYHDEDDEEDNEEAIEEHDETIEELEQHDAGQKL